MKTPDSRSEFPEATAGSPLPPRGGFTLIELLVVLVILGILAAIAIPGAKAILNRTKVSQASNDALQLKNAIASYYTEYRRYPTRETGPEDASRPLLTEEPLMDILLASEAEAAPGGLNTRRHVSLSHRNAKPMGDGRYRSGIRLNEDGGGSYWDPWGNPYRVVLDLDYDSRVPAPGFVQGVSYLPTSVIIWSPGKDENDEEAKDNVTTW